MTASVAVVGVSHARTLAALPHRLDLAPYRAAALARSLAGRGHEAVVLATCNRTEVYLTGEALPSGTFSRRSRQPASQPAPDNFTSRP